MAKGEKKRRAQGHPALTSATPAPRSAENRSPSNPRTSRPWSEISGLGQTDYHAIQLSGDTIVAGVFQAAAVSVSDDRGKTFEERRTPDPLVDLEADPQDPARLVTADPYHWHR